MPCTSAGKGSERTGGDTGSDGGETLAHTRPARAFLRAVGHWSSCIVVSNCICVSERRTKDPGIQRPGLLLLLVLNNAQATSGQQEKAERERGGGETAREPELARQALRGAEAALGRAGRAIPSAASLPRAAPACGRASSSSSSNPGGADLSLAAHTVAPPGLGT